MFTQPRPKPVMTKKQQPSMAGRPPDGIRPMASKSMWPHPRMKKPTVITPVTMVMTCWQRMIRS